MGRTPIYIITKKAVDLPPFLFHRQPELFYGNGPPMRVPDLSIRIVSKFDRYLKL